MAITSRVLLLDSFVQFEEREVRLNVGRAGNALSDELNDLALTVIDYSHYDRMYAYLLNRDPSFPEGEFGNLDVLRANFVGVFDLTGEMVFGKAVVLPDFKSARIPQGLAAFLTTSAVVCCGVRVWNRRFQECCFCPPGPCWSRSHRSCPEIGRGC